MSLQRERQETIKHKIMKKLLSIIALVCLNILSMSAGKFRLVMTDTSADGWDNGAYLTLTDKSGSATYELAGGLGEDSYLIVYNGEVSPGVYLTGTWTPGSPNTYDYEIGFQIYSNTGKLLYDHKPGTPFDASFEITENPCELLGNVPVTLLIPSDNGFDISNDMYFVWKGSEADPTEHKVKLTHESSSRLWTVTADIQDYGYTYWFTTDDYKNAANEDERTKVEGVLTPIENNAPVCAEAGPVHTSAVIAGVTELVRYNYAENCDLKDHNYNVDPSTASAVAAPGQVTFKWFPYKDLAYGLRLTITYSDLSTESRIVDELPYTWKWQNSSELKLVKWAVTQEDKISNPLGEAFEKEEELVIAPYTLAFKNVDFTVNADNTATISWDEMPDAGRFWVQFNDGHSVTLVNQSFNASELTVTEGKYVLTTPPLTGTGTAYVQLQVFDKDDSHRGSTYKNKDISTLSATVGEAEVSVLIPTDMCSFDVSGGVWVRWQYGSDPAEWVKATTEDGVWFTAKLNVNKPSYSLTIGNKDKANWSTAKKTLENSQHDITAKKSAFYLEKYSSYYIIYPADETTKDHDYRVKALTCTVDEATATISYKVETEKNLAPRYDIALYKNASDVSAFETMYCYPTESDAKEYTRVEDSDDGDEGVSIAKVVVTAYDEGNNVVCEAKTFVGTGYEYTIPYRLCVPQNLDGVLNGDNSLSFSWDAKATVTKYEASVSYNYTKIGEWTIKTSEQAPEAGKYTVKIDRAYGNGTYNLNVYAYTEDGYCTYKSKDIDITGVPPLGKVSLRVLIPSDNNFPEGDGKKIFWIAPGGMKTELTTTKNGQWYEATVTVTDPFISCLVANKSDLSGQQSYDSRMINATSACFEMEYNSNPSYYDWTLADAECTAADHDYRVTNVEVDQTTVPGMMTATLTTAMVAPTYVLYYKVNGSTDPYQEIFTWESNGQKTVTFPSPFATAVKIDWKLQPRDEYASNQIADAKEWTLDMVANPNIPSDLKATVGADGQTVEFSWKKNGTVDHFAVEAWTAGYTELFDDAIAGTSLTHKFNIPGSHDWRLTALDANNVVLGFVNGIMFSIDAPDLRPTDLNAAIASKTATLQWDAPESINKCYLELYSNSKGDNVVETVVERKGGLFTYQYTLSENIKDELEWWVYSVSDDGTTRLSETSSGTTIEIDGRQPDPTPATHATLTVKNGVGGTATTFKSGTYPKGTVVNVKATPISGGDWYFEKWSNGYYYDDYDIVVESDTVVYPIFSSYMHYMVKLSVAGTGGKVNSEINGIYYGGKELEFKATANSGYNFDKWSDGDKDKTRSIVLAEDMILSASFKKIVKRTLTVEISGNGTVKLDGVEEEGNKKTVDDGKKIELSATAGKDYTFDHYEIDGTNITSATYSVTMDADKTVKAVFKETTPDPDPHSIDNVNVESNEPMKMLRDGQLYILYNGTMYNVQGQKVK